MVVYFLHHHKMELNHIENGECICQENNNETKSKVISYINETKLINVCSTFEGQEINLFASFMGKQSKYVIVMPLVIY